MCTCEYKCWCISVYKALTLCKLIVGVGTCDSVGLRQWMCNYCSTT